MFVSLDKLLRCINLFQNENRKKIISNIHIVRNSSHISQPNISAIYYLFDYFDVYKIFQITK